MEYDKLIIETMLNHLDEGIFVVNTDAEITFFNESATDIAGITGNKALGKNILEVFPELTKETSTFYRVLRTREAIVDSVQTYVNHKGKKVSIVTSTIPLFVENELVGAIEIYRDLTQVQELSDKILNLQERIVSKDKPVDNKKNDIIKNGTIYSFDSIIGRSSEILELKEKAIKIANSNSPIFIYGETGTGKELIVQAIHNKSKRRNKAFIAQNCAALPSTLLESILFGTTTGSFTGAKDKPGLFELADGGTLFLDEMNSMDIQLQGRLLRVLQDGIIRRVGGNVTYKTDVRIIASTNEHPKTLLKTKRIREDLYYRLNVLLLELPPLRKRKEDINILVNYFIEYYNQVLDKVVLGISIEGMEMLRAYDWPGNIRELKYVIERIMNFVNNNIIEVEDVSENIGVVETKGEEEKEYHLKENFKNIDLSNNMKEYEKKLIMNAILNSNGNCANAARILKIPKQTLHNKIKRLDIHWDKNIKFK